MQIQKSAPLGTHLTLEYFQTICQKQEAVQGRKTQPHVV